MDFLAVFARWPAAGRVKTRLSPALPSELARDLYEAMLRDILETGRASGIERRYLYWADPPKDRPWLDLARAAGFQESLQRGADLGLRLEAAFDELLAGADDHAVVVGADAPELQAPVVRSAFSSLFRHDLVLGPTRDGGYYLVGLRRRAPEIFRDVPWGTGKTLARTLENAKALGLTVARLEALDDVDTPEDLVRLLARCHARPGPCPNTAEALRRMCLLPSA